MVSANQVLYPLFTRILATVCEKCVIMYVRHNILHFECKLVRATLANALD